mmetsp:Transcript_98572/g.165929  ORF Transcript_98572/g.165929 Transcript_98572/m.165929 type:complete len:109 (-) Transcript_98572:449-775(-)
MCHSTTRTTVQRNLWLHFRLSQPTDDVRQPHHCFCFSTGQAAAVSTVKNPAGNSSIYGRHPPSAPLSVALLQAAVGSLALTPIPIGCGTFPGPGGKGVVGWVYAHNQS